MKTLESLPISREQISEWAEGPVTEFLASLIEEEINSIKDTPITDCLVSGDPNKTQENLVELEARERVWLDVLDVLKADWGYFIDEESDEDRH